MPGRHGWSLRECHTDANKQKEEGANPGWDTTGMHEELYWIIRELLD
jgi:hypothetical protein